MKLLFTSISIWILLFSFIAISCKDSQEDEIKNGLVHYTYYIYNIYSDNKYEFGANDTLDLRVGDSLTIYQYKTSDSEYKILTENNATINVGKGKNGGYQLTALMSGFTTANFVSGEECFSFYLNIKSRKSAIQMFKTPNYVVDVANDTLKNKILEQLESTYAIGTLSTFNLIHLTMQTGTLTLTRSSTTSEGSFEYKDDDHLYIYLDNHQTYHLSFKKREEPNENSSHYYYQELTKTFLEKYPGEKIREVSVNGECYKSEPH